MVFGRVHNSLFDFEQRWSNAQRIEGLFDGIRVGSLQIDTGAIVLTTGPEADSDFDFGIDGNTIGSRRTTYLLVSLITGNCPPRPLGLSNTGMSCIAFVEATCDLFTEDFQTSGLGRTMDSECQMDGVSFMWGRNFVAYAELVAVVAGLNDRLQPNQHDHNAETLFFGASVQAAMFVLGTLSTLPTVVNIVNPRINIVYYAFMVILLVVAFIVAAAAYCRCSKQLDIPTDAWQLMILAKEHDTTNPRQEIEKR